jgi:diphthine synthase
MTLYFIGLGLNDEKDISLRGLEIVKKADVVYLENYTSKLNCPVERLEHFYGKKLILANRKMVEEDANKTILKCALKKDIAFLVIGEPFSATTHIDLFLRAKRENIDVRVIYNASIITAVGITGLQIYKFGRITSIPLNNENIETPYDVLKENLKCGLHTLFLLDLRPEDNKFMNVNDAIRYLLRVEIKRGENIFTWESLCVGCAKISSLDQIIKVGKARDLIKVNFKDGVHCLIVPGKLHFIEEKALKIWE